MENGLESASAWAERAAREGAELVAFPETWIPGYPMWVDVCRDVAIWDNAAVREVYARLAEQSVNILGPEGKRLREIAGDSGVTLVIGAIERVAEGAGRGTLYNSLFTFGADGRLLNHHRKLMPTHGERLVWGAGDAEGLRSVECGSARVGGLICWEHWMPLARQATHLEGEDVHIAAWPAVGEMHLVASRHYAFEGRCWVLACGSLLRAKDLPTELEPHPDKVTSPDQLVMRGGSCVIAPDGSLLAEPVFDEERLIVAELDLGRSVRGQMTLDVTGHYARADVLRLDVVRRGERAVNDAAVS